MGRTAPNTSFSLAFRTDKYHSFPSSQMNVADLSSFFLRLYFSTDNILPLELLIVRTNKKTAGRAGGWAASFYGCCLFRRLNAHVEAANQER